jgi:alpha-mannosidase
MIDRKDQEKELTVHIIPSTHDDIGWVKTVDEYFSGTNQKKSHAMVSKILDSVVEQMSLRPNLKFTYSEMKFFTMWWNRQPEKIKAKVRQFVKEGRFEFTNAGWSANDEACPTYDDIIDNMMIGHRFLKEEFGVTPRVAWLVDSFGHSSGNARLYSDMGFEALFVSRMEKEEQSQMY